MAVPVRLSSMPEHIRAPHLAEIPGFAAEGHKNGVQEGQPLLEFPKSTCVLWDGTSIGQPVFLHVAQHRKPKIRISEKVLWLIGRQCESEGSSSRVLVGSLSVDDDAEGVWFHIDGLDTRQSGGDSSADMALGDVMIPVQVSNSRNQDRNGSVEDYISAIEMLKKRVCGHEALELSSLLLVKGWCSFYSNGNSEKTVAHLQFDVVTMATVLKATPVNPVPIVPTALAKNLTGPRSLSHLQGRPKCGYLTMDHTRKLLLVLESDPKVSSLPIVGIWVSGIPVVQHPFVWTACLRYLHSDQLQDRVCTPPEGFLLVLYSPLHSKPEFYEMCTVSGKNDLQFDLYTGYEITSFYKKSSGAEPTNVQWEVCPVRNGPKREMFDAAVGTFQSKRNEHMSGSITPNAVSASEDIMPRSTPAPHRAKAMVVRPMVPEVSMLWNDDSQPAAYPPLPVVSRRHVNNGPTPASHPSSRALPLASSRMDAPAFVNDVLVNSNSNSNYEVLTSSQPPRSYVPQQGVTARHPAQNRTIQNVSAQGIYPHQPFQPAGPHEHLNFVASSHGHTLGPSQHVAVSQLSKGVPQYLGNHQPSMGYPAPHSQGPSSVPFSAVYQPHVMPATSVSGDEQPRSLPPSSACLKQHPSIPSVPGYGGDLQHYVPQSLFGPEQARSIPPSSAQGPHLLPPSAFHLCQPKPAETVQQNANLPYSAPCCQGRYQSAPSTHSSSTQGIAVNQQIQPGQPPVRMGQPQQQAGQPPASGGQPLGFFNPKAVINLDSCAPVSGGQATHPHMSSQRRMVPEQQQGGEQFRNCTSQGSFTQSPVPNTGQFASSTAPYTQVTSMPSGSLTGPSLPPDGAMSAGYVIPFPSGNTPLPNANQQVGSDTTQADSTSCSGKSSDDSGLSVTPDRSNPSPKPSTSPQTSAGHNGSTLSLGGRVNWEGVPPEVVQLLVQQDAQLRVLQAQIQQLLAQQQQQQQLLSPVSSTNTLTPTPTQSSFTPTPSTPPTLKKPETCSIAVNTTIFSPERKLRAENGHVDSPSHPVPTQYASVQTSPQKPPLPDSSSSLNKSREGLSSSFDHRTSAPNTPHRGAESAGQTPSEIRHQGAVQLHSTRHDEGPGVSGLSVGSASSDSSRLRQQQHYQGLSSPARMSDSQHQASLSQSTPSPQSASMCVRTEEGDGSREEEVSPDSKEYYDQLISNIRMFLNCHSKDAEDSNAICSELPSADEAFTPLKLMESTVPGSPRQSCPSGGVSTNTTMLPHINYLSMMLESESDTSLEINAMAMKYLRDEQLTQMARLRQGGATRFSGGNLLRQVLAASADATSMSDTSRLGSSANNMSMATKKYLEKYGLMGGGEESMLDTNQTIQLQTDFSMAVTSEPRSGPSLPPSPQKNTHQAASHNSPGVRSPVKKEVLQPQFKPSPAIAEEVENIWEDRRRMVPDLGASPVLRPPGRRCEQNARHREPSPEDTPIFPERYHAVRAQDIRTSECSTATEDDRILDIEKLRQMPKLL